jgi:hypothetical protein
VIVPRILDSSSNAYDLTDADRSLVFRKYVLVGVDRTMTLARRRQFAA